MATDKRTTGRRDTSADGLGNKLQFWWMASRVWKPFWSIAQAIPPVSRRLNAFLIDNAIMKAPPRPQPLSTMADYTSWDSLVDRTWSARHLPPRSQEGLPAIAAVAELFRKPEGPEKRSTRSTLLFPSFAQWFTDGFLRTRGDDPRRNTSNHEIDLSPLYGLTPAETDALRSKKGGRLESQRLGNGEEEYPPFLFEDDGATIRPRFRGVAHPVGLSLAQWLTPELKGQLFATGGDRANTFIGTSALQTLFLREHNRVASLIQNAHGWDDERTFQTTRNVLIVLLIKIVVEEYINHITPYHFQFKADPSGFARARWYRTNRMAVEFSMVYRWHGLIPENLVIGGQEIAGARALFHNKLLLERGLGPLLEDLSRQSAGALGLFNTPSYLVAREAHALEIARVNRLARYNDYRALMGYPRASRFQQLNGDPRVQEALAKLYKTVDDVELYPGLFAEEVRPNCTLPALIGRIVGMDAFSQAFTNPLLAENVFRPETFSRVGWSVIQETSRLQDILERNVPPGSPAYRIFMTRRPG